MSIPYPAERSARLSMRIAPDALDAISIGHELLGSITPRVRQILAAT